MPLNWTVETAVLSYKGKPAQRVPSGKHYMNVFQIAWSLQLFMDHVPSNPKLEDALMM